MRYTIILGENGFILVIGEQHEQNPQSYVFLGKEELLSWLKAHLPYRRD